MEARYVQGNILRHLIAAASASSVGMLAIFVVDLADLFFISLLGEPQLAAAVGFSGMLFFFTASIGMALSVASSSLISKALGADDEKGASQYFLDVTLVALALGVVVAIGFHFAAPVLLGFLGAKGEVLEMAQSYFRIVNWSLPLLLTNMTNGSAMRAAGRATMSMQNTILGGAVNAVLDPLLIFGLWIIPGLGLEGAAIATVISRFAVFAWGSYATVNQLGMLKGASLGRVTASLGTVSGVAVPSLITSLSTPIAGAYVTSQLAPYGDGVIAGVSVFGRVLPIAFVGLFTLSMALAPVVGQNFGAKKYDRVRGGLLNAAVFSFGYTIPVAIILGLYAPLLARAFSLGPEGAEILAFYCQYMSFTYAFFGLHLAASQTFTNTGHPSWSTAANLIRDIAFLLPLVALLGSSAQGVLMGQYGATVLSGLGAFAVAWWLTGRLIKTGQGAPDPSAADTHKFHRPVTAHSRVHG